MDIIISNASGSDLSRMQQQRQQFDRHDSAAERCAGDHRSAPDPARDTVTMLPFILTAGIVLILMLRDAKQKKNMPIAAENQATV